MGKVYPSVDAGSRSWSGAAPRQILQGKSGRVGHAGSRRGALRSGAARRRPADERSSEQLCARRAGRFRARMSALGLTVLLLAHGRACQPDGGPPRPRRLSSFLAGPSRPPGVSAGLCAPRRPHGLLYLAHQSWRTIRVCSCVFCYPDFLTSGECELPLVI